MQLPVVHIGVVSVLTLEMTPAQVFLDFGIGPSRLGFSFYSNANSCLTKRLLEPARVAAYADGLKRFFLVTGTDMQGPNKFRRLKHDISHKSAANSNLEEMAAALEALDCIIGMPYSAHL